MTALPAALATVRALDPATDGGGVEEYCVTYQENRRRADTLVITTRTTDRAGAIAIARGLAGQRGPWLVEERSYPGWIVATHGDEYLSVRIVSQPDTIDHEEDRS